MAKVLEIQLQYQPFNEYSGLISFGIDWFDLSIQGTLRSLLQQYISVVIMPKSQGLNIIKDLFPHSHPCLVVVAAA